MKKLIINENWDQEEIEVSDTLFTVIYSQGLNEKYVLGCSIDNIKMKDLFEALIEDLE